MKRFSGYKLISLCAAGLFVLLCAPRAQAGFVSPEFETVAQSSTSMAGATDGEEETPRVPEKDIDQILLNQVGLFSPGSGSSAGNVNTVSQGGASGSPAVADLLQSNVSGGQLTAYLLSEADILLTVPFLDGVFRPPRG